MKTAAKAPITSILILAAMTSASGAVLADELSTSSAPAPAASESAPATEKSQKLELTTKLRGRFLEDQLVRSDTGGSILILDGSKRFNPELSADLTLLGAFSTGTASNLITSEGRPSNSVFLGGASLNYTPIKEVTLQAGVLDSSLFFPPFAGDGSSFPGLAQTFSAGGDALNASISVREMIPTANSASLRQSGGTDPVPRMLMNSLTISSKPIKPLSLSGMLTYFNYTNLGGGMADESRVYGNTLTGVTRNLGFAYGFEGLETRLTAELNDQKKDPWSLRAQAGSIWNSQAPESTNRGYVASVGGTLGLVPVRISADFLYFLNQSDTMPASYGNGNTAYNNRVGPGAQLKISPKSVPITFFGTYFQMNEIAPNPYQADRSIVQVGAETTYAIF